MVYEVSSYSSTLRIVFIQTLHLLSLVSSHLIGILRLKMEKIKHQGTCITTWAVERHLQTSFNCERIRSYLNHLQGDPMLWEPQKLRSKFVWCVKFYMKTRDERTRLEDCGDYFHVLKYNFLVLNCLYIYIYCFGILWGDCRM
ncbi:hypothetical protein Scep_001774 [Stephania cephalantha]|uniref:Uncharacterized protein n=1 Tax=Stephania cephalantha TaxID=152367 RepID=A0AAP0Q4A8_9MAGN